MLGTLFPRLSILHLLPIRGVGSQHRQEEGSWGTPLRKGAAAARQRRRASWLNPEATHPANFCIRGLQVLALSADTAGEKEEDGGPQALVL